MAELILGVLISGRGTNLQALIDACQARDFPARIGLVVSNEPDAYGLERARAARLPICVVDHRAFACRASFEEAIDAALRDAGVELVCLAGFMRLLSPWFVDRWKHRAINIHPSLLPAFPGLRTHERVLANGVRWTGCSVHFVCNDMDAGPIIVQAVVPVYPDDDAPKLAERVLNREHIIYPLAVRLIAEKRVHIHDQRVDILAPVLPDATGCVNPAG